MRNTKKPVAFDRYHVSVDWDKVPLDDMVGLVGLTFSLESAATSLRWRHANWLFILGLTAFVLVFDMVTLSQNAMPWLSAIALLANAAMLVVARRAYERGVRTFNARLDIVERACVVLEQAYPSGAT